MFNSKLVKGRLKFIGFVFLFLINISGTAYAQQPKLMYVVIDGKSYVQLSKSVKDASLDSFMIKYELTDLAIKKYMEKGYVDSILYHGWKVERNSKDEIIISKPFQAEIKKKPTFNDDVAKSRYPYLFRLNGFEQARQVMLTGSFNGWRKDELPMNRNRNGWELPYTLGFGNYEYRFIVDGTEITDPSNPLYTNHDRNSGNSLLILGATHTFRLTGYKNARSVILVGDFNQFNDSTYYMKIEKEEWVFNVYLSAGKHLYKFIVDGKSILDPENNLSEQIEAAGEYSVLWMKPTQ